MVVGVWDEAVLGATDTFAAEQGAGGEAVEDLENDILYEASHRVSLVGASSISLVCKQQDESLLSNEITEEENNPTNIHQWSPQLIPKCNFNNH